MWRRSRVAVGSSLRGGEPVVSAAADSTASEDRRQGWSHPEKIDVNIRVFQLQYFRRASRLGNPPIALDLISTEITKRLIVVDLAASSKFLVICWQTDGRINLLTRTA